MTAALYVAPAGTEPPDMQVRDARFVVPWPDAWRLLDTDADVTFERDLYRGTSITVVHSGRADVALWREIVDTSYCFTHVAAPWESRPMYAVGLDVEMHHHKRAAWQRVVFPLTQHYETFRRAGVSITDRKLPWNTQTTYFVLGSGFAMWQAERPVRHPDCPSCACVTQSVGGP